MAKIKVDTDKMQAIANQMQNSVESVVMAKVKLERVKKNVPAYWKGKNATQLTSQLTKLSSKIYDLSYDILSTRKKLCDEINKAQIIEQKNKSIV